MCSDDDDSCCDGCLSPTAERRLLLTLVWSLITFAYISYYVVIIFPWEYYKTLPGILHILFFNVVVALLVYSYTHAIFVNAGDVPKNYVRSLVVSIFSQSSIGESCFHSNDLPGGDLNLLSTR